jgi:hypothetical protein
MSSRMVRGFAALGTFALITVFASSAVAQPAPVPVRVIQGSDGTMYLVQGSNSWTLVPDQVSDSDVGALNPSGEIDGTLPNDLFIVQAPAAPPATAPAPPVAAPAPAGPAPITGTADLTGKVASDAPGTSIALGATITSVVSSSTKSRDVYAIALAAGTPYQLVLTWLNNTSNVQVQVNVLTAPGLAQIQSADAPGNGLQCAWRGTNVPCTFTVAASDTYYVQVIGPRPAASRYTFMVKQT